MHERKAAMAARSDAFVVLPGGLGTLEEAFETISWTQLGLQDKPTGFLNVAGFFDPLRGQLDRMVGDAFVRQQHRDVVYFEEQPARCWTGCGASIRPACPGGSTWTPNTDVRPGRRPAGLDEQAAGDDPVACGALPPEGEGVAGG
jgi:predicted Rossmann-fold nucleotide-binding protein